VAMPEYLNSGDPTRVPQTALLGVPGTPVSKSAELSFAQLQPRVRFGLPPRALRRVREYVETHLQEDISLQMLASTAGLSLSHMLVYPLKRLSRLSRMHLRRARRRDVRARMGDEHVDGELEGVEFIQAAAIRHSCSLLTAISARGAVL
jgi:hypothetical protein